MMNEYGKSDSSIVPEKLPNKACNKAAEAMEERGLIHITGLPTEVKISVLRLEVLQVYTYSEARQKIAS